MNINIKKFLHKFETRPGSEGTLRMGFKLTPGCLKALKLPMGPEVRLGIEYYSLDLHLDWSLRCTQDVSSGEGGKKGGSSRRRGSRVRETDF